MFWFGSFSLRFLWKHTGENLTIYGNGPRFAHYLHWQVATKISADYGQDAPLDKIDISGPGFLNFYLDTEWVPGHQVSTWTPSEYLDTE